MHMRKLKYSKQREAIKDFLSESSHPTADEIYIKVREQFPNVSLGTVYRNLNLLSECGEIRKLTFPEGPDHFDNNTTPHYHFVCMDCGEVYDVFPQPGAPSLLVPQDMNRFGEVKNVNLQFRGICNRCRAAAGKEK